GGFLSAVTALVADDHPAVLEAVASFLQAAGLDVVGRARDGEEALELIKRSQDDVIGAKQPYPWRTDADEKPAEPGTVIVRNYQWGNGRTFPVEIATHELLEVAEDRKLMLAFVTDLSERRRMEQQLVQSGKLAAIGELAAGVAHEINNPLLAILGLTEFLLLEAEPGSKQQERLNLIQETGHEIKEIVRSLLDFAREHPDTQRVVELESLVQMTIALVRRTNAHKGVEFVERYTAGGAAVRANGDQLEQVVLNLVANARQAMPNGGVVRIETVRESDHVCLVIADEGPGMTNELQERIFEPFFTTRRGTGGTGLGLSVSLGIAEAHGGTLTVFSEPGQGAAFTVRLPVVKGTP
ncbi:MAG TPA: ATP-binding protein, partial [Gaiellaceae bacterium]|nr:ATP-binding protein [Gaiellaceae bacterium]